jgi:putative ABC transport system substrate-binding protein
MKRREFIAIAGGAAAWPLTAGAQQSREMRRIAVLMGTATTDLGKSYLATFLQRLEQLGWANGRNARVETRWWIGTVDEMRPVVGELIAFSPDVVMAFSNPAVALLKSMASTIPVVFVGVGDPIGDGFVSSLAHPGGNITGFAGFDGPIGGKWLEVLKETVPQITSGGVHDAAEIERAITFFATKENGGIIVNPHALTWANEGLIIALTLQRGVPSHFATAACVKAGGLVCYGYDYEDTMRKTADYVDRILKGEKPADLPVQAPTKFELVINLKTAKALGLTIPPSLLASADEVIE